MMLSGVLLVTLGLCHDVDTVCIDVVTWRFTRCLWWCEVKVIGRTCHVSARFTELSHVYFCLMVEVLSPVDTLNFV